MFAIRQQNAKPLHHNARTGGWRGFQHTFSPCCTDSHILHDVRVWSKRKKQPRSAQQGTLVFSLVMTKVTTFPVLDVDGRVFVSPRPVMRVSAAPAVHETAIGVPLARVMVHAHPLPPLPMATGGGRGGGSAGQAGVTVHTLSTTSTAGDTIGQVRGVLLPRPTLCTTQKSTGQHSHQSNIKHEHTETQNNNNTFTSVSNCLFKHV